MGAKYWHFNVNQLGQEDIQAQLDFIHSAKCSELPKHLAHAARAADAQRHRRHYKCETFPSIKLCWVVSTLARQIFVPSQREDTSGLSV